MMTLYSDMSEEVWWDLRWSLFCNVVRWLRQWKLRKSANIYFARRQMNNKLTLFNSDGDLS